MLSLGQALRLTMELEERPVTVHNDDPLQPQGPWSFWRGALSGGASRWGIQLILAWVVFEALTSAAWAWHLQGLMGHSALANYWGELLTFREAWELVVNGGLKETPLGFWVPLLGMLALLWVLWAGWQVQARAVGQAAKAGAWIWGLLDALLLGAIPMFLLGSVLLWFLGFLASSGIQGLGWTEFVGAPLVRLSCISALSLQWWLCRIGRTASVKGTWCLGGLDPLGRHFHRSFLRLWLHPVQWGSLVVGGVLVRVGLHFLVFLLAWYLGGSTPMRVWGFLLLELLATALCAWLLGWFLRLSALFWQHDVRIQEEIQKLERQAEGEAEG
jgi:hypothetical protein